MNVSLIVTVKNEADTIRSFLDSVAAQTRQPEEIVVVDGGSTDGTMSILSEYPLNMILETRPSNIAAGRNVAISQASGDVIAVTDAGCLLDRRWLERITDLQGADVVAGGYAPVINGLFDACQYSMHNIFRSTDRIENFAISSRSLAFRKIVWEELGGYPEWLDFSEDTYFHNRILASRFTIRLDPEPLVRWGLRPDLKSVGRQFFRYMRGDGKAGQHTGRHLARLTAYLAGLILVCMSFTNPLWLMPLALGIVVYFGQPVANFRRLGVYPLSLRAVLWMAALLIVMDMAKMSGYVSGLVAGLRDSSIRP
jgi:glycosyltransferase involved in cell wall biosynthesis